METTTDHAAILATGTALRRRLMALRPDVITTTVMHPVPSAPGTDGPSFILACMTTEELAAQQLQDLRQPKTIHFMDGVGGDGYSEMDHPISATRLEEPDQVAWRLLDLDPEDVYGQLPPDIEGISPGEVRVEKDIFVVLTGPFWSSSVTELAKLAREKPTLGFLGALEETVTIRISP